MKKKGDKRAFLIPNDYSDTDMSQKEPKALLCQYAESM